MTTPPPEETPVTTCTSPPTLGTWTFDLPLTAPLSLNGSRGSHFAHARRVKQLRADACRLALAVGIPSCDRIAVELHYAPRVSRQRDPFNLVATLKPIEDGIVDARVIPTDTPAYSAPTVPVIDEPTGKPGRVYVVVRQLA